MDRLTQTSLSRVQVSGLNTPCNLKALILTGVLLKCLPVRSTIHVHPVHSVMLPAMLATHHRVTTEM
jgi:hypothetical protein